jgi:hypothetical protein
MAQIDEHLTYYRDTIATMQGDIDLMKSGKWQFFEVGDGVRIDKTRDRVRDMESRVATSRRS